VIKTKHYTASVADQGGGLGPLPPNCLWPPVEWRTYDTNAPFFGAYWSWDRNTSNITMLYTCYTSLHFRIYVSGFY